MSTLIAVYNSEGCVGRCDAKCYDASEPECICVCGGMNHGAGLHQATANTRDLAEQWIDDYAKQQDLQDYRVDVPARAPEQLALF